MPGEASASAQRPARKLSPRHCGWVRRGRAVQRILANVWGTHEDPLTNIVDVYIRRLRSKIDDGHAVPLIHTLRGLGYKLEEPSGTP